MSSSERNEMRKVFYASWQKHLRQLPLEALEIQLIDVILLHPELHHLFEQPEDFLEEDFADANPFLHLGLHLALREQVSTNRPAGIQTVYAKLCGKLDDVHLAEHQMMDCLAEILWDVQQNNTPPDEQQYLKKLLQL
jgi:hypothetical protein